MYRYFYLFIAAIELSRCQNMGYSTKSMKDHSSKLYDQNESKEKYKNQTNWL